MYLTESKKFWSKNVTMRRRGKQMKVKINIETWPGKDGWMKRKPLGLKISTSERIYPKKQFEKMIWDTHNSPRHESSIAKGIPIDMLHDFKCHYRGQYRIRYRGPSDASRRYFRSPHNTIQEFATSFAIYK
jgi:hypothetical protein